MKPSLDQIIVPTAAFVECKTVEEAIPGYMEHAAVVFRACVPADKCKGFDKAVNPVAYDPASMCLHLPKGAEVHPYCEQAAEVDDIVGTRILQHLRNVVGDVTPMLVGAPFANDKDNDGEWLRMPLPLTNNSGLECPDGCHSGSPWVFVAFEPCTVHLVPFDLIVSIKDSDQYYDTLPDVLEATKTEVPARMRDCAKSQQLQPGDAVIFPPGVPIRFSKGRVLGKFVTAVGVTLAAKQKFLEEVKMARQGAPFNAEATATMEIFNCAALPAPEPEPEQDEADHPFRALFAKYDELVAPILSACEHLEKGKLFNGKEMTGGFVKAVKSAKNQLFEATAAMKKGLTPDKIAYRTKLLSSALSKVATALKTHTDRPSVKAPGQKTAKPAAPAPAEVAAADVNAFFAQHWDKHADKLAEAAKDDAETLALCARCDDIRKAACKAARTEGQAFDATEFRALCDQIFKACSQKKPKGKAPAPAKPEGKEPEKKKAKTALPKGSKSKGVCPECRKNPKSDEGDSDSDREEEEVVPLYASIAPADKKIADLLHVTLVDDNRKCLDCTADEARDIVHTLHDMFPDDAEQLEAMLTKLRTYDELQKAKPVLEKFYPKVPEAVQKKAQKQDRSYSDASDEDEEEEEEEEEDDGRDMDVMAMEESEPEARSSSDEEDGESTGGHEENGALGEAMDEMLALAEGGSANSELLHKLANAVKERQWASVLSIVTESKAARQATDYESFDIIYSRQGVVYPVVRFSYPTRAEAEACVTRMNAHDKCGKYIVIAKPRTK
jgi:hypothetical protein